MLYIYGRHPVLEALRAGAPIRTLLLAEGQQPQGIAELLAEAEARGIPTEWRPRHALEKLLETGATHQGVVAVLPPFRYSTVEAMLARAASRNEPPFLLLLDGIQDVHNLGALIRTAESAGMHGLIVQERRAAGVTATVYKSSAGAVNHLAIAQVTNLTQTIKRLQAEGLWVAGLEMEGSQPYHSAMLRGPLAIVVGAEGRGLSRLVAEQCDYLVHLPMRGQIGSLNASVAGGILIYEALRQRA